MLLITRREGEGIVVNGQIEVKVLEVRGGRVKLGFEFPTGNSVYRQELFAKIQAENKAAAVTSLLASSPLEVGNMLKNLGNPGALAGLSSKKTTKKGASHGNPSHKQRNGNERSVHDSDDV